MNGTTRFGDFLLLKKLSEDPLGATYRAGRVEGNAVGELLFLRTFSIPEARTAELAEALHEFESSQRVQAPGLTYPVGGGEVGGVAYVVYDYSTGWDLLQVLAAAQAAFAELERDHALLVVERIAKGLTVLHQIDAPGARPCHGFLVPHNVRMTGEGEIELVGLEVGPYLARLAAAGGVGETRAYLSPQVLSGAAPTAADDVYSLGAILWRLLLGQPPPAGAAAQAGALASARLGDGQPLPTGLSELLRNSLAEPSARPAHAGFWHHQLTDWMAFEQIRTTHFDLAFFIHELFRRQIQAEKDEIAGEKKLDLAPKAAEPAPGETADAIPRPGLSGSAPPPTAAALPAAAPASDTAVRPPPRRSRMALVAVLAAVVVAAAGAGWLLLGRGSTPEPPPVQAAPPPPPPASSELRMAQEELERLVRERAQTVGDQIASEYDEHIRSLREQLEQARAAEAEALRSAAAPPAAAPPPTAPPSSAPPPSAPPPIAQTPDAEPTAPAPAAPPPAAPPPNSPPPNAEPSPPPVEPAELVTEDVAEASSPLDTIPAPPPSIPAPAAPAVPDVTPPERLSMPKPVFPPRARQHRKEATVLIKVHVDADGKVIDAQPVIDKPDPYGFYDAATQAARQAKFRPARSDGVPIRMWTTVVVSFKQ
ncbi:MAG TPA: TonB family protein [Thermoanaerobaculia bacterium]|jgi:TonB family protein